MNNTPSIYLSDFIGHGYRVDDIAKRGSPGEIQVNAEIITDRFSHFLEIAISYPQVGQLGVVINQAGQAQIDDAFKRVSR